MINSINTILKVLKKIIISDNITPIYNNVVLREIIIHKK
jgi:hypothetical protein